MLKKATIGSLFFRVLNKLMVYSSIALGMIFKMFRFEIKVDLILG